MFVPWVLTWGWLSSALVSSAFADDAPADAADSAKAVELTVATFPTIVAVSLTDALDANKVKEGTYTDATLTFDSPYAGEGLYSDAFGRCAVGDATRGLGGTPGAEVTVRSVTFETDVPADAKNKTAAAITGARVVACAGNVTVRLLPSAVGDRHVTLTLTPKPETGAKEVAPVVIPVPVTVKVANLVSKDLSGAVLGSETTVAPAYALGAAIASAGIPSGTAGNLVKWVDIVPLEPSAGDGLLASDPCKQQTSGAVRCLWAVPVTLSDALTDLGNVQGRLGADWARRSYRVRAGFAGEAADVGYDLATLVVHPRPPSVPVGDLKLSVLRAVGYDKVQMEGPQKVVRKEEALKSAYVQAWIPANATAAFPPGSTLRIGLSPSVLSDPAGAARAGDSAEARWSVPVGATDAKRKEGKPRPGPRIDFAPAWDAFHDTVKLDSTSDGMKELYAHVVVMSADGNEAVAAQVNIPVRLLVDQKPVHTFEVVNHPAATTLAFVQCRDIVGDATGEDDGDANAARCLDEPGRTAVSDAVATIPIGLHYRWSPFYHKPWLGLGGSLAFLAIGESGLFTGNDTTETSAGITAPLTFTAGLDLAPDITPGDDTAASLGFIVGGGATVLKARDGMVLRPFIGLTMTVPITRFSKRTETTDTAASSTSEEAAPTDGAAADGDS